MHVIFTAKRIVALTVALVIVYIWWSGPQRFYYESAGTWVMLPVICVRLLPLPLSHWLTTTLVHFRAIDHLICLVPILMLIFAAVIAVQSVRKNSIPHAMLALGFTLMVFSIYHFVQPMGFNVVYY